MVYSDKREEVHYNRSATVRMKFLNIKIGEVSPIFCIYGDRGGAPLKAKETAQRPSLKQKAF